jgi:hypothetical protein
VLIESSTRVIPTTEHRRLHQDASDFVRWGRRGGRRTLALYGRPYFSLLARLRWGRPIRSPYPAPCREFKVTPRIQNQEVTVAPASTEASLLTLAASRRSGEETLSFLPETVPRRVPLPAKRARRPLPS